MNFFELKYKDRLVKTCRMCNLDEATIEILKDKLDFGRKKYGDISFQVSEENALNVDIKNHAKEELVDLINYLSHMVVTRELNGSFLPLNDDLKDLIKRSFEVYKRIDEVKLK